MEGLSLEFVDPDDLDEDDEVVEYCTCTINLGSRNMQQVVRDKFKPVTWPEIPIIRFQHGRASVQDVKHLGFVRRSERAELDRLHTIYRPMNVEPLYPGANPRLEMTQPKKRRTRAAPAPKKRGPRSSLERAAERAAEEAVAE